MNKPLFFCCLFVSVTFLFGCSQKNMFKLGQTVSLKAREEAYCDDCNKDVKVFFDKIMEDSRCPEGTTCIWEGKAVVRLMVDIGKPQIVELMLNGKDKEGTSKTIDDYMVTFQALKPYPKYGEKINPDSIQLDLLVRKARMRSKL